MSLYALPNLLESKVTNFLSGSCTGQFQSITPTGNISGVYPVYPYFRTSELSFPAVLVKAGSFVELEPETHVYEGELAVAVVTSIDNTADAVTAHDYKVSEVYDAMYSTGFFPAVNSGPTLHVYGYYENNYTQEIEDNTFKSLMVYRITAQTKA